MANFQIFHAIIFILLGLVTLGNVKGANKPRKYINLVIGILALLIAFYEIVAWTLA